MDENDRQMILAKAELLQPEDQGQVIFQLHPSRPVLGVNPYRTPPEVVDQGLGAVSDPAGAGDGGRNAEFDDNCPVPKKEQSTSDYDYRSNSQKKKKQSDEQCKLDEDVKAEKREIVSRIL